MKTFDKKNKIFKLLTNPASIAIIIFVFTTLVAFRQKMAIDAGIWNYIARMWLVFDLPPYAGAVENKTPGIFYIFALSNYLFGLNVWFPKIVEILIKISGAYMVYLIASRLYNRIAGVFSMLIFGLIMSAGLVDATAVYTESFMVFFSCCAFFILIISQRFKTKTGYLIGIFLSGIMIGFAIAFKQIALATTVALFVFYLTLDKKLCSKFRHPLRDSLLGLTGIITATLISILPLLLSGVSIKNYWECAWQLLLYSGAVSQQQRLFKFMNAWNHPEMLSLYALVFLFIAHKKSLVRKNIPFWGLTAWLFFDFLAVNASGKYFLHHLQQLIPSLSICSGIMITVFFQSKLIEKQLRQKRIVQIIICIILLMTPYRTIIKYIQKQTVFFDQDAYSRDSKEIGLWIKEHSNPEDYILIYSRNCAVAQAYSERRSPSRHFSRMFLNSPDFVKELVRDIHRNQPRYVLVKQSDRHSKGLRRLIIGRYSLNRELYHYLVYEKKKPRKNATRN